MQNQPEKSKPLDVPPIDPPLTEHEETELNRLEVEYGDRLRAAAIPNESKRLSRESAEELAQRVWIMYHGEREDLDTVRTWVRGRIHEMARHYYRPSEPWLLPDNRTVIDETLRKVPWFHELTTTAKKIVILAAGMELENYYQAICAECIAQASKQSTRAMLTTKQQQLEQKTRASRQLESENRLLGTIFRLTEDCGRTPVELAELTGIEPTNANAFAALSIARHQQCLEEFTA